MTPDKRLDQLEPELADLIQKVDRLIETQGKLVEFTTETKAQLEQVRKTGQITADGLAKLTLAVDELQREIRQRFDRSDQAQQEIIALLRQGLK